MLQYHFHKYNKNKHSSIINGYFAYNKLKFMNTKIRKLYDNLKDIYGITVGNNHLQCAKPPNPIVKFVNWNRRKIQNCISVYQTQLCTVSSALIICRRPFAFIKGYRYSDQIEYLLCNQSEVHLSDRDTDKANGPQFIYPYFIGVFYAEKTHTTIILLSLSGKLFLWNGMNDGLMRFYFNFRHITTVFRLQIQNEYSWIELNT